MRNADNPFTDQALVHGALYASVGRITQRTGALHRARVSGRHAGEVIADLACEAVGTNEILVADLGCGRGTTTRMLADRLPTATILAVDLSAALLADARMRLPGPRHVGAILADFHRLPFPDGVCGLVVAAFCLYHSPSPNRVITEIARCLLPGGTAIFAVKSADSYTELDQLVVRSGLDPEATHRPSLYQAAHSGNITELAAASLSVRQVRNETHRFTFPALADVAKYLATSPKYDLSPALAGSPAALAAALRQRVPDAPVTATSVVTYLVALRPSEAPP
ncbi:methyltransferase domain-containing protein [Trebonia sp.]|uniref:class I SAM-dependent methyltransferase n=1 Tax=Trebonia sp. TaxID=2767075 RepID=UPI00262282D8|nr:methyltransferase domain-containing protein [Trebonia sp.]